jgi:hypothetical protein
VGTHPERKKNHINKKKKEPNQKEGQTTLDCFLLEHILNTESDFMFSSLRYEGGMNSNSSSFSNHGAAFKRLMQEYKRKCFKMSFFPSSISLTYGFFHTKNVEFCSNKNTTFLREREIFLRKQKLNRGTIDELN